MKILLNCHVPFMLAHGGAQIQIERTRDALGGLGVDVDNLRWWDDTQTATILHHVGWLPPALVMLARRKQWLVASTLLLTETTNRSDGELFLRQLLIRASLAAPLPPGLRLRLPWLTYHLCDRMIVGLEAERRILERVYGVPANRISVVPLGLTGAFLNSKKPARDADHLIVTGTIGPAKNSLELARLARAAGTPMLFVGKPFEADGPYWREFSALLDGRMVRHHPHVGSETELIALLQRARGYVLMSRYENWSLAAHEAAACGLPVMLPDQRWSRERFGAQAAYFPRSGGADAAAAALREFYDRCPTLPAPAVKLFSWREVAEKLAEVYRAMLNPAAGAK